MSSLAHQVRGVFIGPGPTSGLATSGLAIWNHQTPSRPSPVIFQTTLCSVICSTCKNQSDERLLPELKVHSHRRRTGILPKLISCNEFSLKCFIHSLRDEFQFVSGVNTSLKTGVTLMSFLLFCSFVVAVKFAYLLFVLFCFFLFLFFF